MSPKLTNVISEKVIKQNIFIKDHQKRNIQKSPTKKGMVQKQEQCSFDKLLISRLQEKIKSK